MKFAALQIDVRKERPKKEDETTKTMKPLKFAASKSIRLCFLADGGHHDWLKRKLMFVPNAESAVVDIRKLTEYVLNPNHDDGKHKARLFAAALNLTRNDAEPLRLALLDAVKKNEAVFGKFDRFGQRYTVDFRFEWKARNAIIRSGWIIEHNSDVPV